MRERGGEGLEGSSGVRRRVRVEWLREGEDEQRPKIEAMIGMRIRVSNLINILSFIGLYWGTNTKMLLS